MELAPVVQDHVPLQATGDAVPPEGGQVEDIPRLEINARGLCVAIKRVAPLQVPGHLVRVCQRRHGRVQEGRGPHEIEAVRIRGWKKIEGFCAHHHSEKILAGVTMQRSGVEAASEVRMNSLSALPKAASELLPRPPRCRLNIHNNLGETILKLHLAHVAIRCHAQLLGFLHRIQELPKGNLSGGIGNKDVATLLVREEISLHLHLAATATTPQVVEVLEAL
mmetsp:Transcript_8310/g.17646  ORF Transcript_8310/g.17646 Transcript_8310/m.17646 type:complete len:222 (-) Transcript_8310:119-784(-)